VKAFPYDQRTCFQESQGIAPLAPSTEELAPGLGAFTASLPAACQARPALPGVTIQCPDIPERLSMMPMPARGFTYAGARALRSSLRPTPLLLAEIAITYPYAPLVLETMD